MKIQFSQPLKGIAYLALKSQQKEIKKDEPKLQNLPPKFEKK